MKTLEQYYKEKKRKKLVCYRGKDRKELEKIVDDLYKKIVEAENKEEEILIEIAEDFIKILLTLKTYKAKSCLFILEKIITDEAEYVLDYIENKLNIDRHNIGTFKNKGFKE